MPGWKFGKDERYRSGSYEWHKENYDTKSYERAQHWESTRAIGKRYRCTSNILDRYARAVFLLQLRKRFEGSWFERVLSSTRKNLERPCHHGNHFYQLRTNDYSLLVRNPLYVASRWEYWCLLWVWKWKSDIAQLSWEMAVSMLAGKTLIVLNWKLLTMRGYTKRFADDVQTIRWTPDLLFNNRTFELWRW